MGEDGQGLVPVVKRLQVKDMLETAIVRQDNVIIGNWSAAPVRGTTAQEIASLTFRDIGKPLNKWS
jgi:hypothetical protein